MAILSFLLVLLTLIISLINFFTIRRPLNDQIVEERVNVLLPARNEAAHIEECLQRLSVQKYLTDYRVIVINDASTDETLRICKQFAESDSRIAIVDSPALRENWLGKVSALHSGYEQSDCEYLVTIDADVRLQPTAIACAINQLKDAELDFISPYPRQIAETFTERLIQPLLHWSWMSTVVLRLAEKFPTRSTGIANGQFFVVRKAALDSINGFTSVAQKILDDIELARSLIRDGARGIVVEGSHLARTRMYQSFAEIRQGYGKSLHKAFGGIFGALFAALLIFLVGIYPIYLALQGYLIGILTYLLSVLTRQLSALRARSNPLYAFLHPLSSILLIYLLLFSWLMRGRIQWKGRTV